MKYSRFILGGTLCLGLLASTAWSDLYFVSTAADSGPGSLRQAILDANATTSGSDGIYINATLTIQPATPLPAITANRLDIIGLAENVVIDGSMLDENSTEAGLRFESNQNELRNVGIVNFPADGVLLAGDDNEVYGCGIGYAGIVGQGNGQDGIAVTGAGNVIGSPSESDRNILSGNGRYGLYLAPNSGGTGAGQETIARNNYIGTNAEGATAVPNGSHGIRCFACIGFQIGDNEEGAGNVISGNTSIGVSVTRGSTFPSPPVMSFENNIIGLDASGTSAVPNGAVGLLISTSMPVTIGGSSVGAGNVVSGNGGDGIRLGASVTVEALPSLIEGNFIGTDITGLVGLGNDGVGLRVNTSNATVIDNIVADNTDEGISIGNDDEGAANNTITANRIGVNVSGTALGNGGAGVRLWFDAYDNLIGGPGPLDGNIIAHNSFGIRVIAEAGRNTFSRNSIYSNVANGILLDVDTQDNIAPPVLDTVGEDFLASGTANVGDTVEIFVDDQDEGRTFVESVPVHANGTFDGTVDLEQYSGMFVSATATDGDGNTSAFSTPVIVDPGVVNEGEVCDASIHSSDVDMNSVVDFSELLRVIQLYNGEVFGCSIATEDGYAPGVADKSCCAHSGDYNGAANWTFDLSELLRMVQLFNAGGYVEHNAGEDGFAPGGE